MSEQQVQKHSFWKRKSDGIIVIIDHVRKLAAWAGGSYDVHWRRVDNNRRGAIWEADFLKRYEPTENPREPS
jgi:hypothetical protein